MILFVEFMLRFGFRSCWRVDECDPKYNKLLLENLLPSTVDGKPK